MSYRKYFQPGEFSHLGEILYLQGVILYLGSGEQLSGWKNRTTDISEIKTFFGDIKLFPWKNLFFSLTDYYLTITLHANES